MAYYNFTKRASRRYINNNNAIINFPNYHKLNAYLVKLHVEILAYLVVAIVTNYVFKATIIIYILHNLYDAVGF